MLQFLVILHLISLNERNFLKQNLWSIKETVYQGQLKLNILMNSNHILSKKKSLATFIFAVHAIKIFDCGAFNYLWLISCT